MNDALLKNACEVKRDPIASQIIDSIDRLSGRALQVAENVEVRLSSVINIAESIEKDKEVMSGEFPPLFNSLREKIDIISQALDRIDGVLNRLEL